MKTGVSQKTLKAMIHNALRLRAVDVEVIEHALLRRPRVVLYVPLSHACCMCRCHTRRSLREKKKGER